MDKAEELCKFNIWESLEQYSNLIMSAYTSGIMLANCTWRKIFQEYEYSEFTNQLFMLMAYIPSLIIGFQFVKRIIRVTWLRKSRKMEELHRLEIQLGVMRERVCLAEQSTASRGVRLRASAARLAMLRARVHAAMLQRPCLHLHRHHLDAWEARFQRDLFMEGDPDGDIMLSTSTIFDYNNPLDEDYNSLEQAYSVDSERSSQQSMNVRHSTQPQANLLSVPSHTRPKEISLAANYKSWSDHSLSVPHGGSTSNASDMRLRRTNSAVHVRIAALRSLSAVDQFFVEDHRVSTIIDEWKIGSLPIITVDIKNNESISREQLNENIKVQEVMNYDDYNSLDILTSKQSMDSGAIVVDKESSESMIQTYVNHLWKTKSELDHSQHESFDGELTHSQTGIYSKPINETIIDVMAKFYGLIDRNPIIEPSMVDNCFQNYQKYFEKSYLEQYGKKNGFIDKTGDSLKPCEIDNGDCLATDVTDKNRSLFVVREETKSEVEVEENLIENVSDEEWQNSDVDTLSAASEDVSYGTLLTDFRVKRVSGDCAGDCVGRDQNAAASAPVPAPGKLLDLRCSGLAADKQKRTLGLTEICIKHFTDI